MTQPRNEAGQWFCICVVCGDYFWATRFNAKFCSHNHRLQDKRRERPKPATIVNTCEICGKKFVGRRPYMTYKTCGAPDCRLAIRRRRARQFVNKGCGEALKRSCLKCGREFRAANRFIRICVECKGNLEANTTGCGWWGAVI